MIFLAAENVSLLLPIAKTTRSNVKPDIYGESSKRLYFDKNNNVSGVRALTDVSFELKAGDRLALIGRNGSGKTTLLQALAGILIPDAGQVVSEGIATSLININLGIQPEASGHRNITLRGLAAGQRHGDIERKRQDIVEFSRLGEFINLPLSSYSAGMRMRLNFAIATAFDPEILLLDEWLSAGDLAFREKATERMQTFVDKAGVLVLASHNQKMLLDNCNLALWLDEGEVRKFGAIDDVLDLYHQSVAKDS